MSAISLSSLRWGRTNVIISTWPGTNSTKAHIGITCCSSACRACNSDFPECVAKGSRFTFGIWGWKRVRSMLLLCSQPFATVWRPYGRAYRECCKSGHFWRTGARLLQGFQNRFLICRGRRSTLDLCCVFLRIALSGLRQVSSSGDNVQIVWQAWDIARVSFFVASAVGHSTVDNSHTTRYTFHCTLFTLHSSLFTLHSTLHTLHYTPHFTLHTLHITLYTLHLTLHTLHFTLHTLHSLLYLTYFTLCTPHY